MQYVCDWCYGPLSEDDHTTALGRALALIEAGACEPCVRAGRVLSPPDSLHPNHARLQGDVAWRLAVRSLVGGAGDEAMAADTLRQVAGYDA